MHECHEYDENCLGCQPSLYYIQKQKPMPVDDPAMVVVLKNFKEKCTLTQRRAWHRVTMGLSNNEIDKSIWTEVNQIIQQALTDFEEK